MFGRSNHSGSVWYCLLQRHDFCCNFTQPHTRLHERSKDLHSRLQTSLLWPSICPGWLDMRSNSPSLPPDRFHHSFEFLRSVISNCGFSLFFSPLSLYGSGSQKGKWHHVGGKLKTYPQGPAGEPGTSGRRRIPTEEINLTQSMNECFLN